jgi:YD repeat-containing protein
MKPRLVISLVFLVAFSGSAEQMLYRSNTTGMLLERIAPYRRDDSEWIVTVEKTPTQEVRRLLDNGRETRRWETSWTDGHTRSEERETAGKQLVALRVYDAQGNLLREEEYANGALSRTSVLAYTGGTLRRTRVLGPDGAQLSSTEYLYAVNGSLREVLRTEDGGGLNISSTVTGPAGVSEQTASAGEARQVVRYDGSGRIIDTERRRGDTLVSRELFRYRADSDLLDSSTEELPVDGKTIERRYDEAGRIVSETSESGGGEETTYARDDKGRLIAKTRRTPAGLEVWRYTLDASGGVQREEYSRRGSLQKVTTYGKGRERTEDLYRDGALFLRVYFDGDTRLREEVHSGDAVLRERTYE